MPKPLHITCNRERENLLSQTFSGARNVMFGPTTKGVKTKAYKKHHRLSSTQIADLKKIFKKIWLLLKKRETERRRGVGDGTKRESRE